MALKPFSETVLCKMAVLSWVLMKRGLVIIPAYNEEENIVSAVEDLRNSVPGLDFIVVNDGSCDATADICRSHRYPLLDLATNLGLEGAFQAGAKYALAHNYDFIIQFDADGQHAARYIPAMIEEAESSGANVVVGSRFLSRKKSRSLRMFGSKLITFIIRYTTGTRISDPTSGFRLFDNKTLPFLANGTDFSPEPDTLALLILKGFTISEVQVDIRERQFGESYLNLTKSVAYMLRVCISILFMQWFRKSSS